MESKVSLDKKLALAQYIREENHGNRVKIRQREKLLYGKDTQPPLFDAGKLQGTGQDDPRTQGVPSVGFSTGTFKYRMILALLLFVGFLLCDTGGDRIGGYTTDEIHGMIMADTFHLYDADGNDTTEGLAALLDFGR